MFSLKNPEVIGTLLVVFMAIGMMVAMDVGRMLGRRERLFDPKGERAGLGALEGVVFALLGLIVAFTFSGSAERFDRRRTLVTTEVNSIGTAWLRLDLLPKDAQPALRDLFRNYLDTRLAVYRALPDIETAQGHVNSAQQQQQAIWSAAIAAAARSESQAATMLLLPALNDMFDISTERSSATMHHTPMIIYGLLVALAIGAALLAGYGMAGNRTPHWLHRIAFVAVVSATVYVIVDVEYPRLGLIRVDAVDQLMIDLRQSMN
jgi:hypothetical protein